MHRAELARSLQTSRPTITTTITTLLEKGLVEPDRTDTGAVTPAGKAPLKEKLVLSRKAGLIGAVIHHDDATIVGIGTVDGRLLSSRTTARDPDTSGRERVDGAITLLDALLSELPSPVPPLHGIHVAPNILLDRTTGEVLGGSASRPWKDVNPRVDFEGHFGTTIALENIARQSAYAQYEALPEPRPRNLLHVSLSFGIALGQVLEGRIISGAHGGAGELGHISIDNHGPTCPCSNVGCLTQYAGAEEILDQCRTVLGETVTLDEAIDLALAGNTQIAAIFARAGTAVGTALNSACNLLDPDMILVGGPVARAGAIVLDPIRDTLLRRSLPLFSRSLRIEQATSLPAEELLRASFSALRLEMDLPAAVFSAARTAAA